MSVQREEEILHFIKNYIQQNKIAPSVREICDGLDIASTSTVHRYLSRLKRNGYIQAISGKKRAIFISEHTGSIPVVTHIHADTELTDKSNIARYIDYQPAGIYRNVLFAVCAEKHMPELHILEKDILIAEQTDCYQPDKIILIADNHGHISMTNQMTEQKILGVAVALIREL